MRQVLIVDDVQELRELLRAILEEEGYFVIEAADGGTAMDLLRSSQERWVVLLDLMMPRLDGWQVMQRLQQEPEFRADSKVVMSAGWR